MSTRRRLFLLLVATQLVLCLAYQPPSPTPARWALTMLAIVGDSLLVSITVGLIIVRRARAAYWRSWQETHVIDLTRVVGERRRRA